MLYIEYKYKDKPFFRFAVVKYSANCYNCKALTTRKLLVSKGVLAKELHNGLDKSNDKWNALFLCSEKCIKKLMFEHSLKGNVKLRSKVEDWLNAPPQEYFKVFGENKRLIRIIKNQKATPKFRKTDPDTPTLNFVEFYESTGSYSTSKNIQFFASTKWLNETFGGIINLLKEEKVEETNA